MEDREIQSEVIPQFFPAQWLDEAPDIVHSEFPSRIRIGYVLRVNSGYTYVMRPHLERAGLTLLALHEAALGNLREMELPGLTVGKTPGGSEAFLSDVHDNFRAARILLPEVQQGLVEELGDEFFVAIPCRDWFFCWSKNQASEWQSRNIAQARSNFLEDDYRLTPDILLRSNASFALYTQQEV
jgi:uncharacterized protein YtpQ (UPF0354 family)